MTQPTNQVESKCRYIFITKYGVSLDRNTAYLKPLLSDGIKINRDNKYYFEYGDKDGSYYSSNDNKDQLLEKWKIFAKYIECSYSETKNREICSSITIPAQEERGFAKIGNEFLRKILGE